MKTDRFISMFTNMTVFDPENDFDVIWDGDPKNFTVDTLIPGKYNAVLDCSDGETSYQTELLVAETNTIRVVYLCPEIELDLELKSKA